jgi:hypothetical protein
VRWKTWQFLKFKKTVCPLCGASVLTVIVPSTVWSLLEMGMYLSVLIIFFHFALKCYFILKKPLSVSGALCITRKTSQSANSMQHRSDESNHIVPTAILNK